MERSAAPGVALSLQEYNRLYEGAFLNEQRNELEKERQAVEHAKKEHEETMRKEKLRLQEAQAKREQQLRGTVTSRNWLLTHHSAEGRCAANGAVGDGGTALAVFDFRIELRFFEAQWTVVPLLDSQIIADDWNVQRRSAEGDARTDGSGTLREDGWVAAELGAETMLLMQELDGGPSRQVLAVSMPGLYRVRFRAYVFIHSNRNLHSISLALLHPLTAATIRFELPGRSRVQVRELNVTPAAQCHFKESEESVELQLRLPSTTTLDLKWRGLEAADSEWEKLSQQENAQQAVEEQPQVTVVHDALHSIMDGLLQSNHSLKFSLDSEERALPKVSFNVRGPVRVTSVSGHGVLSWKATPSETEGEPNASVEVSFKSSVISDTIIVLLATEMELDTEHFQIPTVTCSGVLRQTGSLGIVKVANVEVHEGQARGMARVGVDELPSEMTSQTHRPIMFAYRYLTPQSHVGFRMVRHEQIGVMEAVAESAFYEVLVSDGQSMHRLMVNLQNSRKQYLEVRGVPASARVWSLVVNSKPAKPVRGDGDSLLVPLLDSRGGSNEGAQATSVELAYLMQREELGDEGSLELAPPKLDVPVSILQVEVQWPDSHEVTFGGSARAVQSFQHPLPKLVNHDVGADMVPRDYDFRHAPAVRGAGVNAQVPNLPRAGSKHRFEQLLVVDGRVSLSAVYCQATKSASRTHRFDLLNRFGHPAVIISAFGVVFLAHSLSKRF